MQSDETGGVAPQNGLDAAADPAVRTVAKPGAGGGGSLLPGAAGAPPPPQMAQLVQFQQLAIAAQMQMLMQQQGNFSLPFPQGMPPGMPVPFQPAAEVSRAGPLAGAPSGGAAAQRAMPSGDANQAVKDEGAAASSDTMEIDPAPPSSDASAGSHAQSSTAGAHPGASASRVAADGAGKAGGLAAGAAIKTEGAPGAVRVGASVAGQVLSYQADGALSVKATIAGKTFKGSLREVRGSGGFDSSRGGPVPVRTQPSVIVIGAGFAGLAAADELHALGCKVVVLEARSRIGGRCWTDDSLGGRVVDLGAGWVHGVVSNPIAELARREGNELVHIPADTLLHDADGKPVSEDTDQEVQEIFNDMLAQVDSEMKSGRLFKPDMSLGFLFEQRAAKHPALRSTAQRHLINWHCANIEYSVATDMNNLSARHWNQDDENAFDGDHCLLKKGYGSLAEALAAGLDIRLGTQVMEIEYGAAGREPCKVSVDNGPPLAADFVLVTVPLGVLKSGSISFSPALPKWKQLAVDRLGYGTLNKVVLAFDSNFWKSATPKGKYIGYASRQKGEFYMFIDITESVAQPTLLALVSGSQALALEQSEDAEVVQGALKVLRLIVGEAVVGVPTGYRITRWGQDPFSRGSYSYIPVGSTAADMDALARPLDGGRVFFAGEHTNSEYPASVHGAFISGRREARQILRTWHDLALPDVIAYAAPPAPDHHLCAFCGRPDDGMDQGPGPLIGPFKLGGKGNALAMVHKQCAAVSPEVMHEGPHWYNVCKAIRRGRRSKCTRCQEHGATIGCYVDTCKANLHYPCAVETGWDFGKEGEPGVSGRSYFCERHRKNAGWQAVHTGDGGRWRV